MESSIREQGNYQDAQDEFYRPGTVGVYIADRICHDEGHSTTILYRLQSAEALDSRGSLLYPANGEVSALVRLIAYVLDVYDNF